MNEDDSRRILPTNDWVAKGNAASKKCQRKDWKAHKQVCTGKHRKSNKKPAPPPARKKKPTPSTSDSYIETLSDDLLVRIGISVGELCGVKDYVSLMKTSKRFHRLLTDKVTQSTLIEKENERILDQISRLDNFGSTMVIDKKATSLVELQLCQTMARLKQQGFVDNNIYLNAFSDFYDSDYVDFALWSIGYILLSNPSVVLILDSHCIHDAPGFIPNEISEDMGLTLANALEKRLEEMTGMDASWLTRRVKIRALGFSVASVIQNQFLSAKKLNANLGWVQVYFRIGVISGFELPLRPNYYPSALPLERDPLDGQFNHLLDELNDSTRSQEERLVTMIKLSGQKQGADVKLVVEALLIQARMVQENESQETIDGHIGMLDSLYTVIDERRQRMAPSYFVPEAASNDYRGLLVEMINKAKATGCEDLGNPEEVLANMEERFHRDGTVGLFDFVDELMQRMINQRS